MSASLVPTFEPDRPQEDQIKVLEHNEEPEMTEWDVKEMHYVFLVDQSYCMSPYRRDKVRDALLIFIRSLPANCRFSVCSFSIGYWNTWLKSTDGKDVIPYD